MNTIYNSVMQYPIVFFGGKGGVGKTTHSASFATYLASKNYKTLIVSTDPAHSLGDAFAVSLTNTPQEIANNLFACELNPSHLLDVYFSNIENAIESYTKPELRTKVHNHLKTAKTSPGAEEAAILEAICKYLVNFSQMQFDKLIFDTAPTGHTLRLFALPELMSIWTNGLLQHQKKQIELKEAAKPFWQNKQDDLHNPFKEETQSRWQKALTLIEERKKLFHKASHVLKDTKRTAIVFVMIPEPLALAETKRAVSSLKEVGLTCRAIIVNQVIPKIDNLFWNNRFIRQQEIITTIKSDFSKIQQLYAPLQEKDIRGVNELNEFAKILTSENV